MFNKLSFKLTLIYVIIIIITIISLDYLLVSNYEIKQFEKNELEYLTYSNVFVRIVRDAIPNRSAVNELTKEYGQNIEGRVLVLNDRGFVIADKYDSYVGREITNKEIRNSIKNKSEAKGYYKLDDEYVLMIAIPIFQVNKIVGVVLISTSVSHIKEDVESLRNEVIVISLIAIALAVILSLITGSQIVKPVRKLIKASENIQRGKLNTRVDIYRNDELGKLALTFNKMSEELHKLDANRRMFISNVSHELKTPLASIKALIESLINGSNNIDTYKEYLTDVNEEIDRLTSLVASLLVTTRLEEIRIKKQPVRLYYELENIKKMFAPLLEEKNMSIINMCNKDTIIPGDIDRFKEVLINLIDNGIKYGKENGYIKVSCKNKIGKIIIKIADNGCGISKKDLPYIFDNFYKVDKSRNNQKRSSGIGLYIVKKIVNLHGWDIKVDSQIGEGTEFTIEIR